jgi:hypothetical protein
MRRGLFVVTLLVCGLLLNIGPKVANSRQTVPKDNEGFKAKVKRAVDLGPEIEGTQGRQLRFRVPCNQEHDALALDLPIVIAATVAIR